MERAKNVDVPALTQTIGNVEIQPMFPIADATSGTVWACTCKGMLATYECNGDNPFRDVNNRQVIYNATSSYSIDTCNSAIMHKCPWLNAPVHSENGNVLNSVDQFVLSTQRLQQGEEYFLEMEATHYGTTALTEAMLDDTSNAYFDQFGSRRLLSMPRGTTDHKFEAEQMMPSAPRRLLAMTNGNEPQLTFPNGVIQVPPAQNTASSQMQLQGGGNLVTCSGGTTPTGLTNVVDSDAISHAAGVCNDMCLADATCQTMQYDTTSNGLVSCSFYTELLSTNSFDDNGGALVAGMCYHKVSSSSSPAPAPATQPATGTSSADVSGFVINPLLEDPNIAPWQRDRDEMTAYLEQASLFTDTLNMIQHSSFQGVEQTWNTFRVIAKDSWMDMNFDMSDTFTETKFKASLGLVGVLAIVLLFLEIIASYSLGPMVPFANAGAAAYSAKKFSRAQMRKQQRIKSSGDDFDNDTSPMSDDHYADFGSGT